MGYTAEQAIKAYCKMCATNDQLRHSTRKYCRECEHSSPYDDDEFCRKHGIKLNPRPLDCHESECKLRAFSPYELA